VSTDGSHIAHESKSDYDTVYNMLDGTGISMIGDHDVDGGAFEFRDRNKIQVGEVWFDAKDQFVGAKWYGQVVVSGRALSQRLALNVFRAEVERTHG